MRIHKTLSSLILSSVLMVFGINLTHASEALSIKNGDRVTISNSQINLIETPYKEFTVLVNPEDHLAVTVEGQNLFVLTTKSSPARLSKIYIVEKVWCGKMCRQLELSLTLRSKLAAISLSRGKLIDANHFQ